MSSDLNVDNLLKLADWLEANAAELLQAEALDMGVFQVARDQWSDDVYADPWGDSPAFVLESIGQTVQVHGDVCDTAACAVGWAPVAGIPKLPLESWEKYSERVFFQGRPIFSLAFPAGVHSADRRRWQHMFGYNNSNDPVEAAGRIRETVADS